MLYYFGNFFSTCGKFHLFGHEPKLDFSFGMKCEFKFCSLLQKSPPYISSPIPFLGHAIAFGKSPIEFLENAYEKVSLPNNYRK